MTRWVAVRRGTLSPETVSAAVTLLRTSRNRCAESDTRRSRGAAKQRHRIAAPGRLTKHITTPRQRWQRRRRRRHRTTTTRTARRNSTRLSPTDDASMVMKDKQCCRRRHKTAAAVAGKTAAAAVSPLPREGGTTGYGSARPKITRTSRRTGVRAACTARGGDTTGVQAREKTRERTGGGGGKTKSQA